jgi:hypothetical protein
MTPRAQERDVTGEAHTPGPWKVWSSLYEGMAAAVVRDVEPLETVAEVRAYRNATLIAAAPDLLKAARRALNVLKATGGNTVQPGDVLEALQSAISRAEGRAP